MATASWSYITVTHDGTNYLRIYDDTVYLDSGNASAVGTVTPGDNFMIGEYAGSVFIGIIDEFRVSNTLRSVYWISNEYNNMASTSAFYNLGSEETIPYSSSGTVTSTNLLSGQHVVDSIASFTYNASSIPAGTELEVQFSQDGTNWYSTSGSLNEWDTLTVTDGETLDLSGLNWSGTNFYYRFQLNSNSAQDATPAVTEIRLNYSSPIGVRLRGNIRLRGNTRIK